MYPQRTAGGTGRERLSALSGGEATLYRRDDRTRRRGGTGLGVSGTGRCRPRDRPPSAAGGSPATHRSAPAEGSAGQQSLFSHVVVGSCSGPVGTGLFPEPGRSGLDRQCGQQSHQSRLYARSRTPEVEIVASRGHQVSTMRTTSRIPVPGRQRGTHRQLFARPEAAARATACTSALVGAVVVRQPVPRGVIAQHV